MSELMKLVQDIEAALDLTGGLVAVEGMLEELKSQLQAIEWVSIEDSLPEDEPRLITTKHVSKVLVWATTTFFEAFYNHDEKIFEFKQGAPISFVTHWRSITPPTE